MALLTRILCRLWGCTPPPGKREGAAEKAEPSGADEIPLDDLSVIRGIGIAIQNRLYAAGIKSYAQLAQASPERVRRILGKLASGAAIEDWIAQAAELSKRQTV